MLSLCVQYLIVRQGDGRVKHCPYNTLIAWRCSEGSFISEEVVQILWEHGADVDSGQIHRLPCEERQNREIICLVL